MDLILLDKLKFLPDVLIHKIINYTNVISYRHGKYIDKISKDDKRYKLLRKIPRPIKVGPGKVLLKLIDYSLYEPHGYFIEYIYDDYIKATIKFVIRTVDGFDKNYITKSNIKIIHDINNNWSKIIDYSM
jgi:hypothetical protein